MSYLVDTNIISEVRKGARADANVAAWFAAISDDSLYLSVLVRPVAEEWGRMSATRPVSVVDGLLAATAKVHALTLVTRNTADVRDLVARVLNPFEPAPRTS